MVVFDPPDDDGAAGLRWKVVDAIRRYGTESSRLAQAFAAEHRLQPSDLQALVAVMSAEGRGQPLTPGQLRAHLGLSSAGTSYVIDRLEKAGHVRREREDPTDGRLVHLRYTEQGMATGIAFFGPLGNDTEELMDQLTPNELATVAHFIDAMVTSTQTHLLALAKNRTRHRPPER